MHFLLSYSSLLFDPRIPPDQQRFRGSSANIISRTLYRHLERRGTVTFVDAASPEEVAGRHFDAFVGIIRNFDRILDICTVDRSVLVAVNMHPAVHNALLLDFVVREKLPSASLNDVDILDEGRLDVAIEAADSILCFGNIATLNSYLRQGVPKEKIRLVNGRSDLVPGQTSAQPDRDGHETHILYSASEIGLRKGFDIVEGAVTAADLGRIGAHLHIIGKATYPHYQRKLKALDERLGTSVTDHGWLPASSPVYRELLEKADFAFFPSLEEGQAGTLLDATACGVIPLISAHCGIDFAPLGFCDLEIDSDRNVQMLQQACALADTERWRLRAKTIEYYEEFHAGFDERVGVALDGCLSGSPWPHVSAILPIHDKEPILSHVLDQLDRALISYGETDLCVILDGCTDRSEEITRRFFASRDRYPVEIMVTPDVFEVRSNNLGLKRATGRYAMVVQDDNFIYDENCIFEAVNLFEKSRRAAIVGGLAGVNFYPRGTRGLDGPGQIVADENEVYWRQDAATDPALRERVFQVDACMRGPLFFSKDFLEEHGYLDEAYAPLYSDDMDICFRAASVGRKVYCILMDVENDSYAVRGYDAERARWLAEVTKRNTDRFYSRWEPSVEKDYLWVHRTPILREEELTDTRRRLRQRLRRRYLGMRRGWLNSTTALNVIGGVRRRLRV